MSHQTDLSPVAIVFVILFVLIAGGGLGMYMLEERGSSIIITDTGRAIAKQKIGKSSLYNGKMLGVECKLMTSTRQISIDCDWSTAEPFKTHYLSKRINYRSIEIKRAIMNGSDCIIVKGINESDISCSRKSDSL